jgi:hypothetical protein
MTATIPPHKPQWRLLDPHWVMIVGNREVARLVPNRDANFPSVKWLSLIHPDFEDHGWHAVDFTTLAIAQADLEQWWFHMLRGEAYRPSADPQPHDDRKEGRDT